MSQQQHGRTSLVEVEKDARGRTSFMNRQRESMRSRQSFRRSSSLNTNAQPFVPHPGKTSQRSLGPVQEECRRVRKQIDKLAMELAAAFQEENYDEVKRIGEKKKNLEDQLHKFEAQYEKDQKDIGEIKGKIERLKADIETAYNGEDFTRVKDLGGQKKKLQSDLSDLEANFGLVNDVFYKVGDKVELTGLQTPRGSVMNGTPGVIREYMPKEKRYKIEILNDDGTTVFIEQAAGSRASAIRAVKGQGHSLAVGDKTGPIQAIAASGSSEIAVGLLQGLGAATARSSMIAVQPKNIRKRKDYQTQPGQIKLWFPKKHFGFITPDNKDENEPDIFFHGSHVLNSKVFAIRRYARVTFRIIPAPKGPQARDVEITSHEEQPMSGDAASAKPTEKKPSATKGSDDKPVTAKPAVRTGAARTGAAAVRMDPVREGSLTPEPVEGVVPQPTEITRWASVQSTDGMDFSRPPPDLNTPTADNSLPAATQIASPPQMRNWRSIGDNEQIDYTDDLGLGLAPPGVGAPPPRVMGAPPPRTIDEQKPNEPGDDAPQTLM